MSANIFDKNNTKEFLVAEYQECFDHMRHYDLIEIDLVKFAFSGYIALITASFALLQYLKDNPRGILYVGVLLGLGFLAGLIILAFAVRNRSYYVIVARQVNSIRKYFLENAEIDFIKYNKCYLDPTKPSNFNPKSTYAFLIYLLISFNASILFAALFLIAKFIAVHFKTGIGFIFTFLIVLLSLLLQYRLSTGYLSRRDCKSADEAIFS